MTLVFPSKRKKRRAFMLLRRTMPELFFFIQYYRGMNKLGNSLKDSEYYFQEMLRETSDQQCLQIGVKEHHGAKFGPNWVSVDLYDTRDFIDYNYDIHNLKFEDESFDAVTCISILEHVPCPQIAIAELGRVLRPGGKIWVQLPFAYPYHESPCDYWRASPHGLRIWMKGFNEIACGAFLFTRTALVASSYFYGEKAIRGRPFAA